LTDLSNSTPAAAGYFSLVKGNPNFRNLWIGQIISLLGDWFNLIASASLIGSLTESGLAVGGLFVVRMLAPFLISPVAGVWADRFDRRKLLIATDISRAVIVLGFLLVRRPDHVWFLYLLTALQLGIGGVFYPTRNAILPDIVNREELGAANALSSVTWSVMLALGAALGGLAAGIWGIYPAFIIDAFSFLVSAAFVMRIQYQQSQETETDGTRGGEFLHRYLQGLRYLRAHRDILAITLVKAAASFTVSGAFMVIQVVVAEELFAIGEGGGISLGLMYAAVGVGTGLGPLLFRRITKDRERPMRIAIITGYGIIALGLVSAAPLTHFGFVLVGVFLRGFGTGVNWVFSTQLLLQFVPERIRGRVFSTEYAILTLANAASAALGGWAIDQPSLGISGTLWRMAGLVLIPSMFWALWVFKGKHAKLESDESSLSVPPGAPK
jgi:MFS family permease